MSDRQFIESRLAALYDLWDPWHQRGDFSFYLPLIMDAESVLDVGCGTGELLRLARERGHGGRLCGLDPAEAMLQLARVRSDVEWMLGDLTDTSWDEEFDLVVMTGHAFQALVTDEELRSALAAIASALRPGGQFVFETRNPLARAWDRWTPQHAIEVERPDGTRARMAHEVVEDFDGRTVTFVSTFTSPSWVGAEISNSTLRFLDRCELTVFLSEGGIEVVEQFGDWDRSPFSDGSPELITVARRDG